MEHAGYGGEHRDLRPTLNFNLGLPHRWRLPPFTVVHRLVLANGLHDSAERRLNPIPRHCMGRNVKGRRYRPAVQWQPTVTTQRFQTILSLC